MKINSIFATSIWDETLYKVRIFGFLLIFKGMVGYCLIFNTKPEQPQLKPIEILRNMRLR
jgi:hypothetical protein